MQKQKNLQENVKHETLKIVIELDMKKLLTVLLVLLASAAWGGDYEDAGEAFNKKDYATAIQKYKSAGINGNAVAQIMVGVMYYTGIGIKKDYLEAVKWYKLAAEQGNASAQYSLGVMYDNGKDVVPDYAEAMKWYKLAAAQGHAKAQFNLAR